MVSYFKVTYWVFVQLPKVKSYLTTVKHLDPISPIWWSQWLSKHELLPLVKVNKNMVRFDNTANYCQFDYCEFDYFEFHYREFQYQEFHYREFHYCNFSKHSRNIWLMRFGAISFITKIFTLGSWGFWPKIAVCKEI